MVFKGFQIKNYKSFIDSGFCSVQKGVTLLAGQNGSGKTNILSALTKINEKTPSFSPDEYSFNQVCSPEILYWFDFSEDEVTELKESFPIRNIESSFCVSVKEKTRTILLSYDVDGELSDELDKKIIQFIEQMIPKFVLYKTLLDDIPDTFTAQDLSKTPIKRLSKYLKKDFNEIFSSKNQQQQRNATKALSRIISDDFASKYKQKSVRLEFNINSTIMSIYISDKNPETDDYGYSFQLSQRSSGLRWYLNFYIALKGEDLKNDDIILVDEPGMYLHPKAQQEMREILNEESSNNQIIYTTHSPYLIDAENIGQVRLVEKSGINGDDGYNEVSVIKERIHHSSNIDTLKPIVDAIGYSLGSELNINLKKILICEGVSDYFCIKALELITGKNLDCGITHANGCSNIGRVSSLFLGLGVSEIYALVDSDTSGIRERNKLIKDGAFSENEFITTHEPKNLEKAIEDIFNREWYLKEIFGYTPEEINNADALISKEMKKKHGGAKYIWAKKLFDLAKKEKLNQDEVLTQDGIDLINKLFENIKG